MKHVVQRVWIAALAALAAGCGLLPDAYSGCTKVQPYQAAQQVPALAVPAGADAPNTRNALVIPEIRAPKIPDEPGRCLEHPPSYGSARPRAG